MKCAVWNTWHLLTLRYLLQVGIEHTVCHPILIQKKHKQCRLLYTHISNCSKAHIKSTFVGFMNFSGHEIAKMLYCLQLKWEIQTPSSLHTAVFVTVNTTVGQWRAVNRHIYLFIGSSASQLKKLALYRTPNCPPSLHICMSIYEPLCVCGCISGLYV